MAKCKNMMANNIENGVGDTSSNSRWDSLCSLRSNVPGKDRHQFYQPELDWNLKSYHFYTTRRAKINRK